MKATYILIADDERNIRLTLRTALESEGYAVQEAADGNAALESILKKVPDLMVLDLSMPGLDGMGVLQRLKPMSPGQKPRVIVLTAYGSFPVAVRATRLGAVDFLEKPVTPEALRESVKGALEEIGKSPPPVVDIPDGGYGAALRRVREALRRGDIPAAETLLMRAVDLAGKDPAYYNLLGVLYELQGDERLARKFYGKAISAKGNYEPAQHNMQRLYELRTFGGSLKGYSMGDEAGLLTEWGTLV